MLTLYSFLCGCAAAGALWRNRPEAFVLLYVLGYAFDCMPAGTSVDDVPAPRDGAFARRYNTVSPLGDWLDHVSCGRPRAPPAPRDRTGRCFSCSGL
jgi:phosphatidylglycerophosphate synthase